MTENDAMIFYKELKEYFGAKLANFENNPKQFAFQVKMFKHLKEQNTKNKYNEG